MSTRTSPVRAHGAHRPGRGLATKTVVGVLGVVAALAGVEHGVGELMQPDTDPGSPFIESWPHVAAFEPLSGEPAMTLIPDLRVAGVVTILVSLVFGWWALRVQPRRRDGWVLLGLSGLLLVVGGGFGPPLVGLALGVTLLRAGPVGFPTPTSGPARRVLAPRWRPLLVVTVTGFLALFPGVVMLQWLADVDAVLLPVLLPLVAFTGLMLTLVAALAHDRIPQQSPS